MKDNEIEWTEEQNNIVSKMIRESEEIGYTEGYGEAIKEITRDLEIFLLNLKSKFYRK